MGSESSAFLNYSRMGKDRETPEPISLQEYALGLYVDTYQGVREVDHSGGGLGTAGHLGRYPDQQVSVAVMCNLDGANVTGMAKSVARRACFSPAFVPRRSRRVRMH
jgi:hypothetical protein